MPLKLNTLSGFGSVLPVASGPTDPDFASVVLLAPFDGTDGDTASSDLSNSNHTLIFNGSAELDDAQTKFGSTSLLCRKVADGDAVSISDHADWEFGSGEFTVECHVRFDGDPGTESMALVTHLGFAPFRSWSLQYFLDRIWIFYSTDGTNIFQPLALWNPLGDVWYHIAMDRTVNQVKTYIDGVVFVDEDIGTDSFFDASVPLWIGSNDENDQDTVKGWIANVRITKGVARYSGAFTPPTEAFPTS